MSTTDTPPPPPPSGAPGGGPRVDGDAVRDLSRLRRTTKQSPEGRYLGGVAGGLARHFDVDPLVTRVALVVLVLFGGAGLVLYIGGWLLIPEEGGVAPIRIDPRSRTVLLWVVLGLAGLAVIGDSIGDVHVPWPLVIVAIVVLWLVTRRKSSSAWAPATGAPTAQPPSAEVDRDAGSADTAQRPVVPPAAPPADTVTRPLREPDPRRTGPMLFWFTVALIALAEGVLGIVDLAGAEIAPPAYPALALGIVGVMLVVGAFVGRAGGLIALGLVATLVLVGTTAGERIGPRGDVEASPTSAAAVAPSYRTGAGSLRLDLTQVADPAALAGRTIEVGINIGDVTVIVPAGMGVDLRARVHGPGNVKAFGDDHGGMGVTYDHVYAGSPMITLVADIKVGELRLEER